MNKQLYYRLIALWVLCEAMLGGIIHGLKIPVSGLIVGSGAVICICLIAWYVPNKGAIIKATLIVAIFKMMLSPQAPPPAYIAVFFQGAVGELVFFRHRKFYQLSCILLAVLALLESGLQRILVLTIVYGNDLWKVINDFINGLTKQRATTNYILLIGGGYVLLHFITGVVVGWWASVLPRRIATWSNSKQYVLLVTEEKNTVLPAVSKKRKRLKKGLFIIWLLLIILYVQSYFKIGTPLLPSHMVVKILLRSLIIIFGWIFIIGPLLKQLLHQWLKKKQTQSQQEVKEVLQLLPATQQLITQSWKQSSGYKGWKRISMTGKMILANALRPPLTTHSRGVGGEVLILTAPIQSGKTTTLINWAAKREDVYGILTPVINGKRFFMNANSKEQFPMEAAADETATCTVGKFVFSKKNFDKAIQVIRESIQKEGWLIIDEIGPLELRGEGFSDIIKEMLTIRQHQTIVVVRDKDDMVEKVKEYFNLRHAIIITSFP